MEGSMVAGIDIGSLSAKAVIMQSQEVIASATIFMKANTVKTPQEVMDKALGQLRLKLIDLQYVGATGYGRVNVPFAHKNTTEISCHAMGN
jgi:activator of 2-hydroxyglutaryl-CoA dehydratase